MEHAGQAAITIIRAAAEPSSPRGRILFLHGWTGDERSMDVLDRALPEGWWRISLRAPYPAPGGGYSWSAPGDDRGRTSEALRPSADALERWLSSQPAGDGLPLVLLGFSQGAALALVSAGRLRARLSGVAILAGFVPGDLPLASLRPFPIYWSHGTQDQLVPVDRARREVMALRQAGVGVDYCEAEVGHKVGAECVRGLKQWLDDLAT